MPSALPSAMLLLVHFALKKMKKSQLRGSHSVVVTCSVKVQFRLTFVMTHR